MIKIEGSYLEMKSTILNMASRKYYGPKEGLKLIKFSNNKLNRNEI